MQVITKQQLTAMLAGIRGATFATVVTATDARLKKTGNPFQGVRKVSRVNVCLGHNYAAAVNRQRDREGNETDFEAAPRQWGERIQGTTLVKHKDKLYLETKVERSLDHHFVDANGMVLDPADVAPFLPARSKSNRQETDKEIIVRDYDLDNILSMTVGGETYIVMQDIPVPQSLLVTV